MKDAKTVGLPERLKRPDKQPKNKNIIIPRSKNACLQGHFCEAVNATAVRKRGEATAVKACVSKTSCGYYSMTVGACQRIAQEKNSENPHLFFTAESTKRNGSPK